MLTNIILDIMLVAIAAASNATMDTLAHHYNKSVFLGLNEKFWKPSVSWRNKYEINNWIPDAISDGWHVFKTIMIFALIALALVPTLDLNWWGLITYYSFLGVIWNGVFNLFYNKILIVEP